jgi:uncharacterized DUF497 family protein
VNTEIEFSEAAFKHGITENDIRNAMMTFLFDEKMDGQENKFMLLGFDENGNLIEVMYNLIDEKSVNVFHAMKCRKELLKLIER